MTVRHPRAALAATLLLSATAAAAAPQAPKIVPGQSVGDVRLGESREDLVRAGFQPVPGMPAESVLRRGPYSVVLGPTGVTQIEYELGKEACADVVLPGVRPCKGREALLTLAERIGGCGPRDIRTGGNLIACGRGLTLGESMAGLDVRVVAPEPVPVTCDVYAESDAGPDRFEVQKGRGYCVGATRLTTETPLVLPKDRACEIVREKDLQVLRCQALHLVYSTDGKTLLRIEYQRR